MSIQNVPEVKMGIVAVSRDCFPIALSGSRRTKVAQECLKAGISIEEITIVVENEKDVLKALAEIESKSINALVIYLGNFGPEGPETMLAQKFAKPVMFLAASEETQDNLINGRGDAYCGLLNASYNIGLRKLSPYIPEVPVIMPCEAPEKVSDFFAIARILLGISSLKIFSFGPRPQDFLACNAPISPLFDLGVEIMENSELDLYESYIKHNDDPRIPDVVKDMEKELGRGNNHPGILPKLAQYELTLLDWAQENLGASKYYVFANKCWPAFEAAFGFVPCFVNSRFAAKGIPIACETDIFGALSEYMITCATMLPATLLDINNTVPYDMYNSNIEKVKEYSKHDLFMAFHCGNTASSCMGNCSMQHQLIMHRLMEPDSAPNITRGTLEGTIRAGEITLFRLQSTATCELKSYVAEGEILDIDPRSFGAIGVFAVNEMARFYRHVLIADRYPHHAGIAFAHAGRVLFATMKLLGIQNVAFNRQKGMLYKDENPF